MPLRWIAKPTPAQLPIAPEEPKIVLAAPGSGVTSIGQLAGKTVAVVQLNSLNSVNVQALVAKAGGDPTSVHLISLPFPQMPQALKSGRVAAAIVVSPFSATALSDGARPLSHPNSEMFPNGTITCIASSTSYIKGHPAQVKGWQAAIAQSTKYAKSHQSAMRSTLTHYLDLSPAAAQHAVLGTNWDTTFNSASAQKQEALLKKFGALSDAVPVSQLFYVP